MVMFGIIDMDIKLFPRKRCQLGHTTHTTYSRRCTHVLFEHIHMGRGGLPNITMVIYESLP